MTLLNQFKAELLDAGLKITQARLAVLDLLQKENRPVDAGEVFQLLEKQGIAADQATIYRILDIFTKKNLITRFEFQEGKFRYEITGSEHHHLICERCSQIEDISDCGIGELEKEIRAKKGFAVKRHSLEFYGICASCQP